MSKKHRIFQILRHPIGNLRERKSISRLFMKHLPTFVVNSGNWASHLSLSLSSAEKFPSQIAKFLELKKISELNFSEIFPETEISRKLAAIFDEEGSDKSSHGYERIYSRLLTTYSADERINLLEIGMGTNSPRLISSMGRAGKPGASLYSFARFDSRIKVIGADIDRDILFANSQIQCFFLDQTNFPSYLDLVASAGINSFDFIIDDGLHSTEANINSLLFAQMHLKPGGYLLIEDIPDRALPVWNLILGVLGSQGNDVSIVRATKCNVVIFKKHDQ